MTTNTHSYPRWSAMHYNALAKEIRIELEAATAERSLGGTRYLTNLAVALARRFKQDRDESTAPHYGFDPIKFLDACSPDTDLYPLSELWEQDEINR